MVSEENAVQERLELDTLPLTHCEIGRWTTSGDRYSGYVVAISVRDKLAEPNGSALRMCIAAALAWEDVAPTAVLLDLTAVTVVKPAFLTTWFDLAPVSEIRVAILCAVSKVDEVTRLVGDLGSIAAMAAVFDSRDEAGQFAFGANTTTRYTFGRL